MLSSAEREILTVLSMCPEPLEELEDMFVTEQVDELSRRGSTFREGLVVALKELEAIRLVGRRMATNGPIPPADTAVWQLTESGMGLAQRIIAEDEGLE